MKLNLGIIGYGLSGEVFHAPLIDTLNNFNLSGTTTGDPAKRDKLLKKYPMTKIFSTAKELIKDTSIHCVVISVPNEYHFKLAKLALEENKHVILEKPMTPTYSQAMSLIELAESKSLLLTVYHNRRFDSDYLTLKNLVNNHALGKIKMFESHFDRYRPQIGVKWKEKPAPGTGSFYDLGSHLIDQCLDLFGLPEALYADLRIERDGAKTIDAFDLILYYKDFRALLRSSSLVFKKGPRFILHGTKGSYIKYGLDPQEEQLKKDQPFELSNYGNEVKDLWGTLSIDGDERKIKSLKGDYRLFYQNVYEKITADRKLIVSPHDASQVIYIIEKAIESNHLKKRIIVKGQ